MSDYIIINGELYHHGVKGMRWGFRKAKGTSTKSQKKSKMSEDAQDAAKIKKKKVKSMSNAELKRLNERTRLEQEYSRLNPGKVKKGASFVKASLAVAGTAVAIYNTSSKVAEIAPDVANKARALVEVGGKAAYKMLARLGAR